MRVLYKHQKLTAAIEGDSTTLIKDGKVINAAMKQETLTHVELISVLNKNGFNDPADVKLCVLEPNGTFYVEGMTPTTESVHSTELMKAVERLAGEVRELRSELAARG